MGRRSGVAETEEDVAKLSLDELNEEIGRCLQGFEYGGTSQGRKAFFKRLVWLVAPGLLSRRGTGEVITSASSPRT
jgi:hypothetical protein